MRTMNFVGAIALAVVLVVAQPLASSALSPPPPRACGGKLTLTYASGRPATLTMTYCDVPTASSVPLPGGGCSMRLPGPMRVTITGSGTTYVQEIFNPIAHWGGCAGGKDVFMGTTPVGKNNVLGTLKVVYGAKVTNLAIRLPPLSPDPTNATVQATVAEIFGPYSVSATMTCYGKKCY